MAQISGKKKINQVSYMNLMLYWKLNEAQLYNLSFPFSSSNNNCLNQNKVKDFPFSHAGLAIYLYSSLVQTSPFFSPSFYVVLHEVLYF